MTSFLKAAAIGLAAMLSVAPAQALIIGTADSSNSIPFGSTLGGYYFQQVYSAAGFSATFDITRLSFYDTLLPGGSPRTGSFQLYLSTTNAAIGTFDTDTSLPFYDASFTQVWNAALPGLEDGRLDFDLSTAFTYDPTLGNLLLTVRSFDLGSGSIYLDGDKNVDVTNSRFSAYPYNWDQGLVTGFNDTVAVPEPASLALFATGLLGLAIRRRPRPA